MPDDPIPGKHLLTASTGGHLAQLVKWSQILGSDCDSTWVTFHSPQSQSLLDGRRVLYVPYVAPRDVQKSVVAFRRIMSRIDWSGERFSAAITTGAAVGLSALIAAHIHRVPAFYFESVSRVQGPSLTGRIASFDPFTRTFCQYESWASKRWTYRRSLFDAFSTVVRPANPHPRIFVTLGTIQPYRFDSLVDAVLETGLANEETIWQLGATTRQGLPGTAAPQLVSSEFERYARRADVVITHAGVGTIMKLLEMGIYPVVVPRNVKRREHVDDHQGEIAALLNERGISQVVEVENLTKELVVDASGKSIVNAPR